MSSTWELKEKSTGELVTSFEGEAWKSAQSKAYKKLAKRVKLPGFRPGNAPAALVKKQLGTRSIMMEAVDDVVQEVLNEAVNEHKLQLVDHPKMDIDNIDENSVTFRFTITVEPEVKLGDYKKIHVEKKSVDVVDGDIDEDVRSLQERQGELVVKEEGKVENGNTAVIDFEGFMQDVPFEGGKGNDFPLEIGSGSFIPGFEEQVLGMKVAEEKEIRVSFPDNYQAPDLAGQEAVFKVKVNEIKEKILPEVSDELIKQAKIENVETVDAYKEYARKRIEEEKKNAADQALTNDIMTELTKICEVEIPEIMVTHEIDDMMEEYKANMKAQGLTFEQFLQFTGKSEEDVRKEIGEDAQQKVLIRLLLNAIAAEEKIETSEEELEEELKKISERYKVSMDDVKKQLNLEAVSHDLALRKTIEMLKESAVK